MKKLLFIVMICMSLQSTAQKIYIPDTLFRDYLISKGIGACISQDSIDTTCPLLGSLTSVNMYGAGMHDLSGIEAFPNVTYIEIDENQLTFLPTLPAGLKYISCPNNQIATIASLPSGLTELQCGNNNISVLPVLPDSLRVLNCGGNPLTQLPTLPDSLNTLYLGSDSLTSLPPFPAYLIDLAINGIQLTSIPPLPPHLKILDISGTGMTSVPILPQELVSLRMSYNTMMSNWSALPQSLRMLDCSHSIFTTLPALPDSLQGIGCAFSEITSLPALPSDLRALDVTKNSITSIDASVCPKLFRLDANYNQLTSILIPSALEELRCKYNHIDSLPSLPSTLVILDCSANLLTSIPSFPDSMEYLNCSYNNLLSLPVFPDSINYLDCSNNLNLHCLPELHTLNFIDLRNTGIICKSSFGTVQSSYPSLDSMPFCDLFNTYGCDVAWNINGRTFNDVNNDCAFSSMDNGEGKIKLTLYKSGIAEQQLFTGINGVYSFNTDVPGIYTVEMDTSALPFIYPCGSGISNIDTISISDSLKFDRNFSFQCAPGSDLTVSSVFSTECVPDHTALVNILAGDYPALFGMHCGTGIAGSLQLVINGPAQYQSSASYAVTPTSVNGDTITWQIADFTLLDYDSSFAINIYVDTTAQFTDQVCFDVMISPVTDNNPLNNILTYCTQVQASHDPNEKEVYPSGGLNINGDHWLTYTVHFQNTGTAPADHIYILDTLDNNLDVSTFRLLSYSHPVMAQVLSGGVARFNFSNINLPDSLSDEPGSHGYVQYKIKAKANLPVGATISNRANIYFDFNPAVLTNTVTNTMVTTGVNELVAGNVNVYPNPSNTIFNVVRDDESAAEIIVTNLLGEVVDKRNINTSRFNVNASLWTDGIYLLQIRSAKSVSTVRLIKQ